MIKLFRGGVLDADVASIDHVVLEFFAMINAKFAPQRQFSSASVHGVLQRCHGSLYRI